MEAAREFELVVTYGFSHTDPDDKNSRDQWNPMLERHPKQRGLFGQVQHCPIRQMEGVVRANHAG
jgi:hypothetical protein